MSTPAHLITLGLDSATNADIKSWFNHFNFLPPIPMTAATVDVAKGPASFEHLLELVAASNHKNFIIIVHGFQDGSGLSLKLAHSRGEPVGSQSTFHTHLQRLMDLDEPGQQPGDLEKTKLGLNNREITQLIDLMHKVRDKRIDCIEFRSCNLGRDTLSLDRFRKFFGARLAGAPDLHTIFGHGPVLIGEEHMKNHTKRRGGGTWEQYNFPLAIAEPDLACCFRVGRDNKPDNGYIVARDRPIFDNWLKKYVAPGASFTGTDMPLHGLWVTGREIYLEAEHVNSPLGSWGGDTGHRLMLPRSENYAKHIIYSR